MNSISQQADSSAKGSALLELAMHHHQAGELAPAKALYRQVLDADPEHAVCLQHLGLIARAEADALTAIDYFRRALAVDENNPALSYNLALTLHEMGQTAEARAFYDRAVKLKPDFAQAHNNLGILAQEQGDYDVAIREFEAAVKHQPRLAEAYFNLSQGQRYEQEPAYLATLEQLRGDNQLPLDDQARVHFALAKIYDDLGRYDEAFATVTQANRLKGVSFNVDAFGQFIDQIMQHTEASRLNQLPRLRRHTVKPVFIVGMPRSGTSLVEQILASHDAVYGGGELGGIHLLAGQLPALFGTSAPYPAGLQEFSEAQLQRLAEHYLSLVSPRLQGRTVFTDKTPINFLHLGLIRLLFPDARIIHCQRDPMDTCLSCFFQNFRANHPFSYDLTTLGRFYRHYQRIMDHWLENPEIDIMNVRYEELVGDATRVVKEILSFCGLPWQDDVMEFHRNRRAVKTASQWQVRQPIYAYARGRWHHYEKHLEPLRQALAGK